MRAHTAVLLGLIGINGVLLLGQVWPEGAPPFARSANIAFACANLAYFAWAFARGGRREARAA